MEPINTLCQFSGDKYKNSELCDLKLIALGIDSDGDYAGRMSLTICTPSGVELPCAFNIFVDRTDTGEWTIRADDCVEIDIGGFEAGAELENVAAYELNQVFCLEPSIRQHDRFIDAVDDALKALDLDDGLVEVPY